MIEFCRVAAAVVLSALALGLPTPSPAADAETLGAFVAQPGDKLAAFEGKAADGATVAWPREGRVTLVHVVDCSSGRCGESTKSIETFVWAPLRAGTLDVVGVARGADGATLAEYAREQALTFPLVPDADGAITARFAPDGKGVPRTVIADATGTIVYQHAGYEAGRDAEWRQIVELLLEGRAPRAAMRGVESAEVGWVGRKAPKLVATEWVNAPPAELAGKWQMFEFWATWCGPCRAVMPEIQKKHEELGERLVIQSISGEDIDTVRAFVTKQKFTWPIGIDPDQTTATEIGVEGIPHGLLVDPEGIVRWEGHPAEFVGADGHARLLSIIGGASGS